MDHLKHLQHKILDAPTLQRQLHLWRFQDKKIVFTNGCFDIIHQGHIHILAQARSLGDVLIVGLNSDASVSRLKGPTRPLQNQNTRAEVLAAMQLVDAVVLFEEDTPLNLIETITPQVLVKGGDYIKEDIVGYNHVIQHGGTVEVIPLVEGHSTTEIERKLRG